MCNAVTLQWTINNYCDFLSRRRRNLTFVGIERHYKGNKSFFLKNTSFFSQLNRIFPTYTFSTLDIHFLISVLAPPRYFFLPIEDCRSHSWKLIFFKTLVVERLLNYYYALTWLQSLTLFQNCHYLSILSFACKFFQACCLVQG